MLSSSNPFIVIDCVSLVIWVIGKPTHPVRYIRYVATHVWLAASSDSSSIVDDEFILTNVHYDSIVRVDL